MAELLSPFFNPAPTITFDGLVQQKEELENRILAIVQDRIARGKTGLDTLPLPAEIERTHVIIPRNTFMPCVQTSTQYMRLGATSGRLAWNSTLRFDLNAPCDFIWDIFLVLQTNELTTNTSMAGLPPLTVESGRPTAEEIAPFGPSPPDEDAVVETYRYVDGAGNSIPDDATVQNYTYFTNNFLHRVFTRHELRVAGAHLDSYGPITDAFYLAHQVPAEKKAGYLRCIGQEQPQPAYSQNCGIIDGEEVARRQICILDGPQTPKLRQPEMTLVYPYKFNMCESAASAMPVLQIPNTRREIITSIGSASNCINVTSPIFLEKTSYYYRTDEEGNVVYSYGITERNPVSIDDSNVEGVNSFFNSCHMYMHGIFMDESVRSVFVHRIPLLLTRTHMAYTIPQINSGTRYQLNTFKWGIEYLYFGAFPRANSDNPKLWDIPQEAELHNFHRTKYSAMVTGYNGAFTTSKTDTLPQGFFSFYKYKPVLSSVQFTLQTSNYIADPTGMPMEFYESYVASRQGGPFICTPNTPGFGMLSFGFYPGGNAPYGYYLVSRAANFYITPFLQYEAPQSQLHILASGLNFLYVEGGTLLLRFR